MTVHVCACAPDRACMRGVGGDSLLESLWGAGGWLQLGGVFSGGGPTECVVCVSGWLVIAVSLAGVHVVC